MNSYYDLLVDLFHEDGRTIGEKMADFYQTDYYQNLLKEPKMTNIELKDIQKGDRIRVTWTREGVTRTAEGVVDYQYGGAWLSKDGAPVVNFLYRLDDSKVELLERPEPNPPVWESGITGYATVGDDDVNVRVMRIDPIWRTRARGGWAVWVTDRPLYGQRFFAEDEVTDFVPDVLFEDVVDDLRWQVHEKVSQAGHDHTPDYYGIVANDAVRFYKAKR